MTETVKVELTTEEARQFVILKCFISPHVNQKGITYWHLKRLEPALDRIREALAEAGHPDMEFDWEAEDGC